MTFSNLLVNIQILSSFLWTCILIPSYLYSATTLPNSFMTFPTLSAFSPSITCIGCPNRTFTFFNPLIPFSLAIFATSPKSDRTFQACSTTLTISFFSSLLIPSSTRKAFTMASLIIPSATPILNSCRIVLTIYLASFGCAEVSNSAIRLSFLSCEPTPVTKANFCKFSKTLSMVNFFLNKIVCFLDLIHSSVVRPRSPVFLNFFSISSGENPVALEIAFIIICVAMPNSHSEYAGKTLPAANNTTFGNFSEDVFENNSDKICVLPSLAEVSSNFS